VPVDYLPILILAVLSAIFAAIAVAVPSLLGPKRPSDVKLDTYESGMLPYGSARRRYPVEYYVVAVLFILFDIEVIFLYPWAVNLKWLGWFGLIEMGIFLLILLVGYIFLWRKGVLNWR